MKLEHMSLILGLTKSELKKRLDIGLLDPQILNRQINEYSDEIKLDALCDSWMSHKKFDQVDQVDKFGLSLPNEKDLSS